jgi:hypothetical protein
MLRSALTAIAVLVCAAQAVAQLPPPPEKSKLHDWPMPWGESVPNVASAKSLIPAPAGKDGFVQVRHGRFFAGEQRIRFWGVNFCFAGCFPTHAEADEIANRLAHFGVNAVRFHHIDMLAWPNGIFADKSLTKLHPEAVDRLEYFVAALKKQGIYSNINLHVSRSLSRAGKWPNADKLPGHDKFVDLFHPELIAAQKQYARDLLTHTSPYTGTTFATEPAVAMVEINNENSFFLWGGEAKIAGLPEPYAGMFREKWNRWLLEKYKTRDALAAAWEVGAQELGPDLLSPQWNLEQRQGARLEHIREGDSTHHLNITNVTGTSWHAQFNQPGLELKKGQFYTLTFRAKADKNRRININASQAHEPWSGLGLAAGIDLTTEFSEHRFGFRANADDDNARITFVIGQAVGRITLADIRLREGGVAGLLEGEDPAQSTVAIHQPGSAATRARTDDWFTFLQQTDEAYFVDMYNFLKNDLGIRVPIAGTIGLGGLGTLSQTKMDFIDAHSYWDHPNFPGQSWSSTNWRINNRPMSDDPAGSALWSLVATRVEGMPFTVTEYNHSAPNDYAAETIPMIASLAATQDWDGVFLFAYSHNAEFKKDRVSGFFDIEGDPLKWPLMPLGARIFLTGNVKPNITHKTVRLHMQDMLAGASTYYHQTWAFIRDTYNLKWSDLLSRRFAITFTGEDEETLTRNMLIPTINWTTGKTPGTGQFTLNDDRAIVFAGFAAGGLPVDLGVARIESMQTPFATIMIVPADGQTAINQADRLLISAVARAANQDMEWDDQRRTVSNRWGKGPVQIEPVQATVRLIGHWKVQALSPEGTPIAELPTQQETHHTTIPLTHPTIWYLATRTQ